MRITLQVLSDELELPPTLHLSTSIATMADRLLSGESATVVVHNSEAMHKTEMVSLPLPICAVDVSRTGAPVVAQVNAQFSISDATAP